MNDAINQTVSLEEAREDFSKVVQMADAAGAVIISMDDRPRYKLVDLEQNPEIEMTDDEKIDFVAARILKKYHKAFEELAK